MQYLLLELKFTFAYFQNACKISWTSGETKTPIFFFFTKHYGGSLCSTSTANTSLVPSLVFDEVLCTG